MDQPDIMVDNPAARGQLNRGKYLFPFPRSRLRLLSRETGSAVPSRVSLLILNTQAESGFLPLSATAPTQINIYMYMSTVKRHQSERI